MIQVRPYDMMLLLRTDVEDHKTLLEELQALVATLGGEVAKVDVWERGGWPILSKRNRKAFTPSST
ncbi:MAG: hypothetical protein MZU95_07610 [Desulfomicrobium escambiense]|nr:hypothetical protein [Desulfomicrobium escambiense]